MKPIKEKGKVVGYEDLTYDEAMGEVPCPTCGKKLEFYPNEEYGTEEAECCGKKYQLYPTLYNVEEV